MTGTRLSALALTAALALAPSLVLPTASAAPGTVPVVAEDASGLSVQGEEAFADLSSCLATNGSLLATIVVDESGSLRQTDPEDQRVGGVEAAIDALVALESSNGGAVDVEANLAVFSDEYTELVGWGSPTGAHGDALLDATATDLPWRDRGAVTDYRAALRGAQQAIVERRGETGGSACSAILWFTDGRLDVGDEGEGEATAAAREELCVPQGIVDGVRAGGTAIIALALFTEGAQSTVTAEDRERLRAIAEGGASDGTTCGTAPIPASSASGAYLRADRPDALRRLFSGAGALIEGGTPAGSVVCPGDGCVDGVLTFPVDDAVGAFRLIFETDEGAAPVVLVDPSGQEMVLDARESEAASARVDTSVRSGLHVTDVVPGPDAPAGYWRLVTDPGRVTVIDLYHFWGVTLSLDAPAGLVLGERSEVVVSALGPDGEPVDPGLLSSVTTDVLVEGEPAEAQVQDDGTVVVGVDLTGAQAAAEVDVQATMRATSAPNGIPLGPVTAQAALATQLPPSYPTLATTRLELTDLVGDEPASGTLSVTGSERGPTRVCFAAPELAGPPDAGAFDLAVPECVDVPANETVEVAVELTSAHPADGVVSGTLPVSLSGVDAAQDVTLAVPVTAAMVRPVNEAVRWGIIAALLLLALLVPAVVAWVGRRVSDTYPLGADLRSASVPVDLTSAGVRRVGQGELLVPDDFDLVGRRRPAPRFETKGLAFDRHGSWWPWSPLRGRVRSSSGTIVVSGGTDARVLDQEGRTAPVELPGTRQFYVVVDPTADPAVPAASGVRAHLVLLVDAPHGVQWPIEHWTRELRTFPGWADVCQAVDEAQRARAGRAAATAGRESHRDARPSRAPRRGDAPRRDVTEPFASDDRPPSLLGGDAAASDLFPPHDGRGGRPTPPPVGPGTGSPSPYDDDGPPPSLF